jgi:CubicO group peptidase (beta-lactamase class C family)
MQKFIGLIFILGLFLTCWPAVVNGQENDNTLQSGLDRIEVNECFLGQSRDSVIYDSAQLDSLIEVNMTVHHLPGVAICVVRDSNIVYTRNFGWANIERNIPVSDTTVFLTGSISKTFVANAAMQMRENGYLDLDADINDYIPFSVINPHNPGSEITMRTILSHTSSIDRRDDTWTPDIVIDMDHPTPLGQYLQDYLDPGGANYDPLNYLTSPPGFEFEYSNYAMALAGYIIEQIAINNGIASSLEQYCQDSLWQPLGMDETSWFLANLDTNNIAVQYTGGTGRYGFSGFPIYPAGQLRTSSVQLARHLMAFMLHGELNGYRILETATIDSMMTIQYPEAPSDDIYSMWGIGWYMLFDNSYPYLYWGHTGATTGCRTWMMFDPVEYTGFIVLTNGSSGEGTDNIAVAVAWFARDYDIDGIISGFDNCPFNYNPDQEDFDDDGVGDSCDNCIYAFNDTQEDFDGDGDGDACDIDIDDDLILNDEDNCPYFPNPDQLDDDEDGVGNLCDNCIDVYNPDQPDENDDGIGDHCDGDVHIQSYTLPDGYIGIPYSYQFWAVGGEEPYYWRHISGQIPDGLTFYGGGTGALSGTPTFISDFSFEIEVQDASYPLKKDTVYILMHILEPEYICGDASGDGTVNVSDAVYIINYVFVGGDPPYPLEAGDCNCDGNCNVSDAVWIINYVFVGGNNPCDTNGDDIPDC